MKKIVPLLLALLVLGGCSDYKKLQLTSWDIDALGGFSIKRNRAAANLQVHLGILNPTGSSYVVKAFQATLHKPDGTLFAELVTDGEVKVEPRSDGKVPVMLEVSLANPLAAIAGIGLDDLDGLTADIDMTVKSGAFTRRIRKKGVPVEELLGAVRRPQEEEKGEN